MKARPSWFVVTLLVLGCSSSGGDNNGTPDSADAVAASDSMDSGRDAISDTVGADTKDAPSSDVADSFVVDAPLDAVIESSTDAPSETPTDVASDTSPATPTIYASSNTELFSFDPTSASLSSLGAFDCIGGVGEDTSMTDIAVDAAGNVYGVSPKFAYALTVAGSVVHCAKVVPLSTPSTFYGLSMAPAGVVETSETLLGATTAGELWEIDLVAGTLTEHGTFGVVPATDGRGHSYAHAGLAWELSGDVVFGVGAGGATVGFVTLRDCPSPPSSVGCNTTDTLAEIDVSALAAAGTAPVVKSIVGQIVRASTCSDSASGYGSFYGLALATGNALGFNHTGSVVSIDFTTGEGCAVLAGTTIFGGAGVTDAIVTSAP